MKQTTNLRSQKEWEQEAERYTIYQLKEFPELRDYAFEPLERLHKEGRSVSHHHYEAVYTGRLPSGSSLEELYMQFNIEQPADFTGHSLSVSDVVVLQTGQEQAAFYCDRIGFTQVPEFLNGKQTLPCLLDPPDETYEQQPEPAFMQGESGQEPEQEANPILELEERVR